jgi:hypothetical protein
LKSFKPEFTDAMWDTLTDIYSLINSSADDVSQNNLDNLYKVVSNEFELVKIQTTGLNINNFLLSEVAIFIKLKR